MRRFPLSFIVLTALGGLCAIPGAFSLAGFGGLLHPVLEDPMAGLAFLVSAIRLATRLMLSASASDDPPYFWTTMGNVLLP